MYGFGQQEEDRTTRMDNQTWKSLCEAIMLEKDPQRLMTLVEELNQALEHREQELRTSRKYSAGAE
jgi:hypothetical protein